MNRSMLSVCALLVGLGSGGLPGCAGGTAQRQALLDRGAEAGRRGDVDEAEAAFRGILKRNPDDGLANVNLGSVYLDRANAWMAAGDPGQAEAAAEQALVHFDRGLAADPPGPPMALLLSGRILTRLMRPQPAQERLTQFLELGAGSAADQNEARELLAEAIHLSRYVEGTRALMPVIRLDGQAVGPLAERKAALTHGAALLEHFVADEPNNWAAHWFIGKAYQALEDHDRAIASLERAYAIAPTQIDVGRELAIEATDIGDFPRAVEVSEALLALEPENAGLRANLAFALLLAGDVDRSVTEIRAAFTAAPQDPINERLHTYIVAVHEGRMARPETYDEAVAAMTE